MSDNETEQIMKDVVMIHNFDLDFQKICIDEWNKRREEIEQQPTDDEPKTYMLSITGLDKKNILLKLKNKKEYKMKFPCDSYYTTFKLVENQLVAYEPRFPMGREVKSSEEVEKESGKPMFSEGKFNSARGFFLTKLAKFGYETNDATAIANHFGFNSASPIHTSLFAVCLANFLDKHKMTMIPTKKGFALGFGADEHEISEKLEMMHMVLRCVKGIKGTNSNYTN
jgi:hypothetical protein